MTPEPRSSLCCDALLAGLFTLLARSEPWVEGMLLERRKNEPKVEAIGGDGKVVDTSGLSSGCRLEGEIVEGAEPLTLRKEEKRPIRGRAPATSASAGATSADTRGDGVLAASATLAELESWAIERCFVNRDPKKEPMFVAKLAALPPTSAAPARTVIRTKSVWLSDRHPSRRVVP